MTIGRLPIGGYGNSDHHGDGYGYGDGYSYGDGRGSGNSVTYGNGRGYTTMSGDGFGYTSIGVYGAVLHGDGHNDGQGNPSDS